jgi:hypothetical protein
MLNTELVDSLYASLTSSQQKTLTTMLFKKSKQTMSYFKRTKDISLSKLEILADFFHMPLDYFRTGSNFKTNNVSGSNNFVGNVSINTNLMVENEMLRSKVSAMEKTIEAKDLTIKILNETVIEKKAENYELKAQLKQKSTNE